MKLQVNNRGAWKQVLTFGIEHIEHVKLATADLSHVAAIAEEPVAWRILDATETAVLLFDTRKQRWQTPIWMLGREIVP